MFTAILSKAIHFAINLVSLIIFTTITTTGYSAVEPVPTREVIIQTSPSAPSRTPTPEVIIPTVTTTPAPTSFLYTVQAGDSLAAIAARYGLTWMDLASLNQLTDPDHIAIGQAINISLNPEDYKNLDPYFKSEIMNVEGEEKHIFVKLSEQKLYLYEGESRVGEFLISSGLPGTPTVTGVYKIWIKLESTTMSLEGEYNLPNVPYTMYFYGDYAIHGTYWHNNFGTPMSHGCINLSKPDAEIVFNWAEVGTIVQVVQ